MIRHAGALAALRLLATRPATAEQIGAPPGQKRISERLSWAGRQVIDNNQERLNTKGVGWRNLLPAKWKREIGQVFAARTAIGMSD